MLDGPAAPAAPPGAPLLLKVGAATGAAALLVGAAFFSYRPAPPGPLSSAVTPNVAPSRITGTPPASSPLLLPPVAASAAIVGEGPPSRRLDTPGANSTLAHAKAPSEASLLEQARRALNGSPSYALQLANQHRARYPHGILAQEREVIAIEALRRLHRSSEAEQRAAGFSKAFPGSAHQRMVDEGASK